MELYLLRHAAAENHSPTGRDADRQLTQQGIATLRRVLKQAHLAGLHPSLILSSPYVRAIQTAEIAQRLLKYEGEILRSHSLTPDSSPAEVWAEIRTHRQESSILEVAHEPLLSATASWLLGSTRVAIEFIPAMMVRIDLADFGAEPRGLLRRIFTWDRA